MLSKSLQIIIGLLGTAIRAFALIAMILEALWGFLLAALCFWIASRSSTTGGVIAAVLAFLLVTACTLVVAFYFACLSVVRKAMSDAGLGRTIFDTLFDYALGVSGEDTGDSPPSAKMRTHMSRDEVKKTLDDAVERLLSDETPSAKWASPFFWMAKQIQRISIWATVHVIVKSCSHDGTSVNMFELRDRLASTIDDGIVSYLRDYFTRLTFSAISVASFVSILLAYGISQFPL